MPLWPLWPLTDLEPDVPNRFIMNRPIPSGPIGIEVISPLISLLNSRGLQLITIMNNLSSRGVETSGTERVFAARLPGAPLSPPLPPPRGAQPGGGH